MAEEVTLGLVLERIQSLEQRIGGSFEKVESHLTEIKGGLVSLESNLTRQIDGIDKRLDEIEIESLPSRLRVLEAARKG